MSTRSILKNGDAIEEPVVSGRKKRVYWGDLTVYEFPNLLGDNPAVSEGVPLTIGWEHEEMNVVAIDYYEYMRQSRPRRRRKDMIISSGARDTFLLGMGYTLVELVEAAEETRKIRKSRQSNMKGKTWDKFKQVFEGAARGLRKGSPQEPKIVVAKCG